MLFERCPRRLAIDIDPTPRPFADFHPRIGFLLRTGILDHFRRLSRFAVPQNLPKYVTVLDERNSALRTVAFAQIEDTWRAVFPQTAPALAHETPQQEAASRIRQQLAAIAVLDDITVEPIDCQVRPPG